MQVRIGKRTIGSNVLKYLVYSAWSPTSEALLVLYLEQYFVQKASNPAFAFNPSGTRSLL